MSFDDAIADRQTKAGSAARRLGCIERLEDLGLIGPGDSYAVVFDLHHDLVAPGRTPPGSYREPTPIVHCVHGVQHQGHEHLGQLFGISPRGGKRHIELARHREMLESLMVLHQEQRLIDQGVQHHAALGLAFGPAEVEQPVHDPAAAIHFLVDQLQVFLHRGSFRSRGPVEASGDGRDTGADGGQRVIDLVHHTGRELTDGRQLFALHDLTLDPARLGHVFADGDDMSDLVAVQPHGNLGQPERPQLPAEGYIELGLYDLAGLKHPVELGAEFFGRLPSEHLEDLAADHLIPPEAGRTHLALPVPDLNPVLPVDNVQTNWKAVDDESGEPALLIYLSRLRGYLDCEIGRERERGQKRRQKISDDGKDLELFRIRPGSDLQQTDVGFIVLQREPHPGIGTVYCLERLQQQRDALAARSLDAPEAAGGLVAIPDGDPFCRKTGLQSLGHCS